MSTIAHGVFGDALWSPKTRSLNRIEWFLSLVPDQRQPEVSLVSDL